MAGFIADTIIIAPADLAGPDAALINRCSEFIIANQAYEAELGKPDEEGDGPVCFALAESTSMRSRRYRHDAAQNSGRLLGGLTLPI